VTEKLYYIDSHMRSFEAAVLSCMAEGERFAVRLDRTAFFPKGGGQPSDFGNLGGARVLHVREDGDEVTHLLDAPLKAGERVRGELDWARRFRHMQCHSGEHIVSGTVHELTRCSNVGFHMGESAIVLDFDAELSPELIRAVERSANEAVWANLPVRAWFPTDVELRELEYRSKKAIDGALRIVEIPGVDRCACCAPHVSLTGEVGAIKIIDSMRHRGGMRLTVVCGSDALADYDARCANITAVSRALSAKPLETGAAVERVIGELNALEQRNIGLSRELLSCRIAALEPTEGSICIFADMDEVSRRELVNAGMDRCGGVCAVFSAEGEGYRYVIGSRSRDLRAAAREINAAIDGRGGGSETMIQGTAAAGRETIERYFGA